jgi:pilin isopeptide linkage protein
LAACLALACLLGALFAPTAYAAGPGEITLTVQQAFAGDTATDIVCTYRLTAKAAGNPMPQGSGTNGYVLTLAGNASAQIGPISFVSVGAGIYVYELVHETSDKPGYTYDRQVYTVEIYAQNGQNGLEITAVAYTLNRTKALGLSFAHTYDSGTARPSDPKLMVDPPVIKTVSGSPSTAAAFSFRLVPANPDNPMPAGSSNNSKTVTVTGSGSAEFGTWSYTKEGVYTYIVHEVDTGLTGYTYDTAVYVITDAVAAADGQLVLTRVVTNNAGKRVSSMAFINKYTAQGGKPGDGPKTGDDAQSGLYTALLCLSVMGVLYSGLILIMGRRRREAEDKA